MITLFLESYFSVLLSIGTSSLFIFIVGVYWIMRHEFSKSTATADLSAIAGDDMIATQLDLARAYIETGNTTLAVNILSSAVKQASSKQRAEIKQLLALTTSP